MVFMVHFYGLNPPCPPHSPPLALSRLEGYSQLRPLIRLRRVLVQLGLWGFSAVFGGLSALFFCLEFSHILYHPCYGMTRKVLRVTPLVGRDLLSVWGLGFLSYGEECQDFVTLRNCMALYRRQQVAGAAEGHNFFPISYPRNTMSGILMSENGIPF